MEKKKERFISSLSEDNFYEIDEVDYDEIEEVGMTNFERRQMKYAMRESRRFFEESRQEHGRGGISSQPYGARIKLGSIRSFSIR